MKRLPLASMMAFAALGFLMMAYGEFSDGIRSARAQANGDQSAESEAAAETLEKKPSAELPEWATKPANEFLSGHAAAIKDIPLIKREAWFKKGDIERLRISPDGSMLSFVRPVKQNDGSEIRNVFVAPIDDMKKATQITFYKDRDVGSASWAYNNETILVVRDFEGNEESRVWAFSVKKPGEPKNLTPWEFGKEIRANIAGASKDFPDELIVAATDTPPYQLNNYYRVNIRTGERKPWTKNEGFLGMGFDDKLEPEIAVGFNPMAGALTYNRYVEGEWKPFLNIPMADRFNTQFHGFNKDKSKYYLESSDGRDTSALYIVDVATDEKKFVFASDKADIGGVTIDDDTKELLGCSVTYLKDEFHWFDKKAEEEFKIIRSIHKGEPQIVSATADQRKLMIAYVNIDGSGDYYLYDRDTKKATFMVSLRKDLQELPSVDMIPLEIKARDGLVLPCYLTLPKTAKVTGEGQAMKSSAPLPLVLDVHGGPNARDFYGFNVNHQFLANRGYAVLAVNYRGSTGFGKKFIEASVKQWGRAMHDDLLDAVQWCIDRGIADKNKVAITGASYGGYATLWGLTNTPDWFACGVCAVGPSNLETLLRNVPASWMPIIQTMYNSVGNPNTEEGRKLLKERSPLTYASQIVDPLLIGQGANDPRVKQQESEQIVDAMKEHGIPVTYFLYPDEGHGWARQENNLSWFAVTEAFLAKHLGGRYEPMGNSLHGSSVEVREGADGVPGLAEALKSTAAKEAPKPEGDKPAEGEKPAEAEKKEAAGTSGK